MDQHTFQPLHFGDHVNAGCSCGWTGPYSHAFEKYAQEDHVDHVKYVSEGR